MTLRIVPTRPLLSVAICIITFVRSIGSVQISAVQLARPPETGRMSGCSSLRAAPPAEAVNVGCGKLRALAEAARRRVAKSNLIFLIFSEITDEIFELESMPSALLQVALLLRRRCRRRVVAAQRCV